MSLGSNIWSQINHHHQPVWGYRLVMSTLGLIVNVFDASPEAGDSLGIFYGLLAAVFYAAFICLIHTVIMHYAYFLRPWGS